MMDISDASLRFMEPGIKAPSVRRRQLDHKRRLWFLGIEFRRRHKRIPGMEHPFGMMTTVQFNGHTYVPFTVPTQSDHQQIRHIRK